MLNRVTGDMNLGQSNTSPLSNCCHINQSGQGGLGDAVLCGTVGSGGNGQKGMGFGERGGNSVCLIG